MQFNNLSQSSLPLHMGKSPSAQKLQQLARFIAPKKPNRPTQLNPVWKVRPVDHPAGRKPDSLKLHSKKMEAVEPLEKGPLSDVVANCVKRWFQETLKEADAGNTAMQVLVGQMYCSGYGTVKDTQMGKAWISKAARCRSSAMKVGDKRPGYNVSDSDSDEVVQEDAK